VLRAYLPTCTPHEIAAFFGPISAMIAEAEDPAAAHVFRPSKEGVEARLIQLPSPSPATPERRAQP
jgi:hypothetical protein